MSKGTNTTNIHNTVVDFTEVRAQRMEEKRRKTERTFMTHFLGVYGVTGTKSMHQIELVDISEGGLGFQVPFNPDKPFPTNDGEMPIRLYFSQDSFLEVYCKIENSRPAVQNGTRYVKYGCSVDPTSTTFEAYQAFVKFLKAYAEVSQKDNGDVSVFFV